MTIFEQPALMMQLLTYQIYSMFHYKEVTCKISIQCGIKLYSLQVNYPKIYPGGFVQVENTGFCSASGCIGFLYEQEIDRDRAVPIYQRYRTMVRRHIDQMVRTRNNKARNERIETGVLVNGHKGKNLSVERSVGECYRWKAIGQCPRGDSCSNSHGRYRGQSTIVLSGSKDADTD